MALFDLKNKNVKVKNNTGFGTNADNYGGRFITKEGEANVIKKGIGLIEGTSIFHSMLTMSRIQFLVVILSYYVVVNLFFAFLYCWIGTEYLNGIHSDNIPIQFIEAFFFSIQTFTTVGYGHVHPSGFITNTIAALEALFGLLSIALATGLFYGRFSKPKAHILFSNNALIAPYKEGKALMIRLTPYKNANLTDAEARVTLGMHVSENGIFVNKFFDLDLELKRLHLLSLSWTLVHPITETSPLHGLTASDFKSINGELIVYLSVFDDMFSNQVVKRTSYVFDEIVYGAKFITMFERNNTNTQTILHIDKLNAYQKVELD